jgi:hypothetical protein
MGLEGFGAHFGRCFGQTDSHILRAILTLCSVPGVSNQDSYHAVRLLESRADLYRLVVRGYVRAGRDSSNDLSVRSMG